MEDYLIQFENFIDTLGKRYGVNPLILGTLYFVSKVSMVSFLGWAFARLRKKRAIIIQILCAGISFCVPYVYIIITGRNIPAWVYMFIALVFFYGSFVLWRKVITGTMKAATQPETEKEEI